MATKSITKNIDIRTKALGRQFVRALEKAESTHCDEHEISVPVDYVRKDKLKAFFGGKK